MKYYKVWYLESENLKTYNFYRISLVNYVFYVETNISFYYSLPFYITLQNNMQYLLNTGKCIEKLIKYGANLKGLKCKNKK